MAETNSRWKGRLALLASAVVLTGLAYFALSTRRPQPPQPVQPVVADNPVEDTSEPPFAAWLQNEPQTGASQAALGRYFVDSVLGHRVFRLPPRGIHPQLARQLLLDDDKLLLSSGRRLWTRELDYGPGLSGEFCYLHSSYCLKRLFEVSFAVDGAPVVVYDNQYSIERFPSHTRIHYDLGKVSVDERKLITWDDRAVATYELRSSDGQPHSVTLEVFATYPPMPGGGSPPLFPLLGSGALQGMPLYLYMDAPGFERLDVSTIHLRRRIEVGAADTTAQAVVAIRFQNGPDDTTTKVTDDGIDDRHIRDYNRWFAENVPYFDASDAATKKMWYYRWWIVRFHLVEAATPDLSGYAFYEGKLGFDNVIGFAVPAQLKELTYLRDPRFGISQARNSYRNRSPAGAVVDPPGSPYWGETYSHWSAAALAEFNRVHPIDAATLRELLPEMAADVRAWLTAYDRDGDGLPERDRPRVTGYDLDILSYWYFNHTRLDLRAEPPSLERVDFASFVYGNAVGTAELARIAGDEALARDLTAQAERVRAATLEHLWDAKDAFFYPQVADTDQRIPIRELHAFFPFMFQLAPDEPRYVAALAALVDPAEFWASYPPVITSQRHYRNWSWEMDGLTRNIAPHPISMGGRTLIQVLKHYHQSAVTPDHFMHLLDRFNDLVYPGVLPSDPLWRPNVHEYYSEWEPYSRSVRPKPSDISHDFHSMYCSLIVEGAVGLTPRTDERIELQPLALRWDYFLLDRLRYHDHDLTVVWDRPDGHVRYSRFPEGFSLLIDGELAFTQPSLAHVLYDPSAKRLEVLEVP
jgi:Mannosylglycerate hydrolase MGH1-like glycoside hydrolase domain